MELLGKLKQLSQKVADMKDSITTEEATKTAFVLPFLNILGYDIFNPHEVVPEFTADIGIKKGEKVDYAIFLDKQPILIIECKSWTQDLNLHGSQLHRYFHVTKTRFALLTNGINFKFYTDLEQSNIMDDRPFMEFSLENIKENLVNELTKFQKESFDVDKILSTASTLKYSKAVRELFKSQLENPGDDLVKLLASQVYQGRFTSKVLEEFRDIVKKAINQHINEAISEKLHSALNKQKEEEEQTTIAEPEDDNKIETTQEEIEAYHIVKSIMREVTDGDRIVHRDGQTYFSVLLDDNNRKPICRLWLNSNKWYLGLFNEGKKENKIEIQKLDDIYTYKKQMQSMVGFYDK